MAVHILRDYPMATTGYFAPGGGVNYFWVTQQYLLPVFMHKILGHSVVSNTGWDINNSNVQTFTASNGTSVAAGSNGQSLPQSIINVISTTSFPNSGTIYVNTSGGIQAVKYSGTTANAFLNCTGGTGSMSSGQATTITSGSNGASLPQATINVATTAGFPTSGSIYVVTSAGTQLVTYTGIGATTFTGCLGGTGSMATGNAVTSAASTIFCGPTKISAATTTLNQYATITTQVPHGVTSGQYVLTSGIAGTANLNGLWPTVVTSPTQLTLVGSKADGAAYTAFSGTLTPTGMLVASGTVAGGTGAQINVTGANSVYAVSIPQSARVVVSGTAPTTGDAGRILVLKSSSYTTKNSGAFKISAANTGNSTTIAVGSNNASLPQSTINVASTAGFPTSGNIFVFTTTGVQTVAYTGISGGTQFTGCTGGTGTMTTGNTVNNFNGYTIDYRSTDTPPNETMDWWLYEVETQVSFYASYPNNTFITGLGMLSTTNTAPIQVTPNLNTINQFLTGQRVTIAGVTGNTNANGTWTITTNGSNTFTLNGSIGNGTSTTSGSISRIGYTGGDGYSFNSKIILQSPHSTAWQSRMAVEPFNIPNMPPTSVSVGFGGVLNGDWPIGGITSSISQYLGNNPVSPYAASVVGASTTGAIAYRMTVMGDDLGQSVFMYARTQGAGANGLLLMGIPSNEPSPLAPTTNRPFVYGGVNTVDYSGIQMRVGNSNNFGYTFRDSAPETCLISGWANADGVSGASPAYATNAGDSPFTGTTELLPWEIWGGTATDNVGSLPIAIGGLTVNTINQRFMGTAPNIRQGRANFGTFTLSTDNTTSLTVTGATATSPIQITTSATNTLVTGQTVVITGVTGNTVANGTFVITVVDNTHFTLNNTNGLNPYTGGGTVNGTAQFLHLQNGIYMRWNGAGGLNP